MKNNQLDESTKYRINITRTLRKHQHEKIAENQENVNGANAKMRFIFDVLFLVLLLLEFDFSDSNFATSCNFTSTCSCSSAFATSWEFTSAACCDSFFASSWGSTLPAS